MNVVDIAIINGGGKSNAPAISLPVKYVGAIQKITKDRQHDAYQRQEISPVRIIKRDKLKDSNKNVPTNHETKISQIRQNPVCGRSQDQKLQQQIIQQTSLRIGQFASNKRRISPIWVSKIEPHAYMRHDRFTLCNDKGPAGPALVNGVQIKQKEQVETKDRQLLAKPRIIIKPQTNSAASSGPNSPQTQTTATPSGFQALQHFVNNAAASPKASSPVSFSDRHQLLLQQNNQTPKNINHESHCKIPVSLQPVDLSLPRQAARTVIMADNSAYTINQQPSHKMLDLNNSSQSLEKQLKQINSPQQHLYMTKSQAVAAQKKWSYASVQPRQLELNLKTLIEKTSNEESSSIGVQNRDIINYHLQQLQQHLQLGTAQTRPIVSKQRATVAIKRQKDFTLRTKTDINDILPGCRQLPQPKQSSEGCFTDHNHYGTNERAQASSTNENGIDATANNFKLLHFLQQSTGSVGELTMNNLLSKLEIDSAGKLSMGMVSPQPPILPKSSKKPKHILVQELRGDLAIQIDSNSPMSQQVDTELISPTRKKPIKTKFNRRQQLNLGHIDDSGLSTAEAALMALNSPLRGSLVNERSWMSKNALMGTTQYINSRSKWRQDSVRQSQKSSDSNCMTMKQEELDRVLRLSRDNQQLLHQTIQQRRLPTFSDIQTTNQETKTSSTTKAVEDKPKTRRVISLENSGISKNNYRESSVMSRTSSHRSARTKLPGKQKYVEVRREMIAMNTDPSRDILQTLLNPYDGFDDDQLCLGTGGGKMTRNDFWTHRASKKRRSDMQLLSQQAASQNESDHEFQPMQILQPVMYANGSGVQSMPACDFQNDIGKLSGNITPDQIVPASQINYGSRRYPQQTDSLQQTQFYSAVISMPQSGTRLPQISIGSFESMTDQSRCNNNVAKVQKPTPSLRQLNPRKFTVEAAQFQTNIMLSGSASTGGTDYLPAQSHTEQLRLMLNSQQSGQKSQETPQLIVENSYKPSISPKKKKLPYKSPYAQGVSRRCSQGDQKAHLNSRFDQTMDQFSPWD